MKRWLAVVMGGLVVVSVAAVETAVACTAAGKDTHVGVVTQVNAAGRQLTIKDAETGSAISFVSESALIAPLKIGDQIVISYEAKDGKLVAKQIKS